MRGSCAAAAHRWLRGRPGGVWSAAGQPDAAQPADLGHPALGEPVGGHGRRHALGVGQREHPGGRVEDLLGARAWARSKENPSSSSATWIRPPALTM